MNALSRREPHGPGTRNARDFNDHQVARKHVKRQPGNIRKQRVTGGEKTP